MGRHRVQHSLISTNKIIQVAHALVCMPVESLTHCFRQWLKICILTSSNNLFVWSSLEVDCTWDFHLRLNVAGLQQACLLDEGLHPTNVCSQLERISVSGIHFVRKVFSSWIDDHASYACSKELSIITDVLGCCMFKWIQQLSATFATSHFTLKHLSHPTFN